MAESRANLMEETAQRFKQTLQKIESHIKHEGAYLALYYALMASQTLNKTAVEKAVDQAKLLSQKLHRQGSSLDIKAKVEESWREKITMLCRIAFFKEDIDTLELFAKEFKDDLIIKSKISQLQSVLGITLVTLQTIITNKEKGKKNLLIDYNNFSSIQDEINSLYPLCEHLMRQTETHENQPAEAVTDQTKFHATEEIQNASLGALKPDPIQDGEKPKIIPLKQEVEKPLEGGKLNTAQSKQKPQQNIKEEGNKKGELVTHVDRFLSQHGQLFPPKEVERKKKGLPIKKDIDLQDKSSQETKNNVPRRYLK